MTSQPHIAPLVLIGFNRPDCLNKQLEIVTAQFNGKRIFAIVDGPRFGKREEKQRVEKVLQLFKSLRHSFEIEIIRSETNLGCYRRIKSGLDFVFEKTDRAIILEDDCLPSAQFFSFASEMLNRYEFDKRIFSVSGTNLFPELSPLEASFFLSRYHNCWGWATWRRAWCHYIDDINEWERIRKSTFFRRSFGNFRSFLYWRRVFDLTFQGSINSWFYRWLLSSWINSGLSVVPSVNLIKNVGDGVEASNTKGSKFINRETGFLPKFNTDNFASDITINEAYDIHLENEMYSKSFIIRLKWLLSKLS